MVTEEEYLAMLGVVVLSYFAGLNILPPFAHLAFRPFRKSTVAYVVIFLIVTYLFLDVLLHISLVGFGADADTVDLMYGFIFVLVLFFVVCWIGYIFTKFFHFKLTPTHLRWGWDDSRDWDDSTEVPDHPVSTIMRSPWITSVFPLVFLILNGLILRGELTNPLTYGILDLLISALENPYTATVLLWAGWIVGGFMALVVIVIMVIAVFLR